MKYRKELKQSDLSAIRDILSSSAFFYDHEIDVAIELAEENLKKGAEESGYIFLIAEDTARPVAFACYGKTPCTESSFDLYWIAVHQDARGEGIGRVMMKKIEEDIKRRGGKNIWIETASRPLYEPTRSFYINNGCQMVAELPGFYAKDDNKLIFLKKI